MSYGDRGRKVRVARGSKRMECHGNWRQTVIDCAGMCIALSDDSSGFPCGEVDNLDLHDPFGEDKHQTGRTQQRILLCQKHHDIEHGGDRAIRDNRRRQDVLNWDVSLEILLCGGYPAWVEKYCLDDSRFGCQLRWGNPGG